ncbi:MAG: VWA domain-containing protein [OCS116 cluster bacterium]|nr:VWA domain-containing protein [OCS116 cluster bacterium]
MMALLLIPMAILLGGALDVALNFNQTSKQQHALDIALLAAVSTKIDQQKYRNKTAQKGYRKQVFRRMFKLNYSTSSPEFTFEFSDKGMKVSSRDITKTTILSLANIKSLRVNINAKAIYPKETMFEIVLIFDATGSMGRIISNVKRNAINFTDDILTSLTDIDVKLDNIDTKVISYKDYWVDSNPMFLSKFYHLPVEKSQFAAIINPIRASGGGDLPESGLEALKFAMDAKSPSRKPDIKTNKIIVLWTDAEAIPLKNQRKSAMDARLITTSGTWAPWYRYAPRNYPSGMPKTLTAYKKLWDKAKNTRLLLFYGKNGQGKNFYPWKQMKKWERIKHIIGNPNNIDYSDLIEEIAETIAEMSKTHLSE